MSKRIPAIQGGVQLRDVQICFGEGADAVEAVRRVDLDISPGEFVSVLGPSGCGKSTLIGAVAGLLKLNRGDVSLDGERVRAPGRERGVVFQQHTLFPWKTVFGNVALRDRSARARCKAS
jgi:NitT/TauT family transport system ATP-binding protein